jgi:hypothetical protein
MNQELQQTQTQESLAIDSTGSNSFNTTTSYSTGTVCQFSGTYVAKNRYMDLFGLYAKGDIFRVGPDGKKTTWTALTTTISTNSTDGGFTAVKVDPGTV